MNFSIEDIGAWSEADLLDKIHVLLADHQTFVCEPLEGGGFHPFIVEVVEDEEPKVVWDAFVATRKLALLDTFGHLWMLKRRKSSSGPWVRRQELSAQSVTARVHGSKIPDPQDLDPEYVKSVYHSQVKGRR